jgi:hypothetical protein
MYMPKKCEVCRLNMGGFCVAIDGERQIMFDARRQSWCPLKKVETVMGERVVDDTMLAHMPKELIEQRVNQDLKRLLVKALDDLPGAVVKVRKEDYGDGLRFRAVARVVIEDEV